MNSHQRTHSLPKLFKSAAVALLIGLCAAATASAQTDSSASTGAARSSPIDTRIVPEFTPLDRSGSGPATPGIKATPGGAEANQGNLPVPTTIGDDYKIAPNDLLEVEVFGVKELNRTVRVNSSGYVALPLIGQIQLGGNTASDAEALVALAYGQKYLQDPQVSIFIKEFTTQRITLDGALTKPGIYPINGQLTLLRALALAGGSAPMADLENVMLFRLTPDGQSLVEKYDVTKIRKGESKDPLLQGDDVVVVNRDSRRTALRDSLFRDIIDTLNPFSASVNQMGR